MSDYCDVSDLPTTQCAHCRGHRAPKRTKSGPPAAVVEAAFEGDCPACPVPIYVGDDIVVVLRPGEGKHWVHAECV